MLFITDKNEAYQELQRAIEILNNVHLFCEEEEMECADEFINIISDLNSIEIY